MWPRRLAWRTIEGTPPFGHAGEEELNQLVRAERVMDGYEGNAQAFRIVTRLANSDARYPNERPIPGLNSTRMTLDGIFEYPSSADPQSTKWGYYKTEKDIFDWARSGPPRGAVYSRGHGLAADIAFAIHDLVYHLYRPGYHGRVRAAETNGERV